MQNTSHALFSEFRPTNRNKDANPYEWRYGSASRGYVDDEFATNVYLTYSIVEIDKSIQIQW